MAKIAQLYNGDAGYTIPMIQMKDDLVIGQQVYDLDDLYPRPFKNMSFKTHGTAGAQYMTGTCDFLLHTQGPAYTGATSCWVTRGKRTGNFTYGASFMVDSDDSNIGWYLLPEGGVGDDNVYLYKISLTTKEILNRIYIAGTTFGCNLVGQDSNNLYAAQQTSGNSYAWLVTYSINKSNFNVASGGNSSWRYSCATYFTEDASYLWIFGNNVYSVAGTDIHRVDKSTGNWSQVALQSCGDGARDLRSIPSQAKAVDVDNDAAYCAWHTSNATNVFEIYKYNVTKSTQTVTSTQCTLDFATAGVTRADVLHAPTNTGGGDSVIESWLVTGGSSDYMCFSVAEYPSSETEATATFKIYIFKIETTDTNLTYITQLDPSLRIRNIMPLESNWTKIAVIYDGGMKIYNWNSGNETYDYADSFAADVRSVMVDQNERVWVYDTSDQLHMFSATTPVRITVTMQNASYNYTGSTINTYANVSAWDTDGNRVAANVKLVLEGSAEFTDTSKSYTFTTSASADTQVNINITGSSFSRAIASVVV